MKTKIVIAIGSILFLAGAAQAQSIRVESESAFVWGQDRPGKAVSSSTQDPLTGQNLETMTYQGITISFVVRYPPCSANLPPFSKCHGETTLRIVNNSDQDIVVKYGGSSAAGQAIKLSKKEKNSDIAKGYTVKSHASYVTSFLFDLWYGPDTGLKEYRQSFFVGGYDFVFRVGL